MHTLKSVQPSRAATRPLGTHVTGRQVAAADALTGLVEFNIPAGPLGTSLLAIARCAGTLVSFKPQLVSTYQAPAIRGRFTLQEALKLALGTSGLSFQMTPSGVVTIVGQASAPDAAALAPAGLAPLRS